MKAVNQIESIWWTNKFTFHQVTFGLCKETVEIDIVLWVYCKHNLYASRLCLSTNFWTSVPSMVGFWDHGCDVMTVWQYFLWSKGEKLFKSKDKVKN